MNQPASLLSLKVNNSADTQYNVFSAEVKYIMLCMDLWRLREYPVDKSRFLARNRDSKGFRIIDLTCLLFVLVNKV